MALMALVTVLGLEHDHLIGRNLRVVRKGGGMMVIMETVPTSGNFESTTRTEDANGDIPTLTETIDETDEDAPLIEIGSTSDEIAGVEVEVALRTGMARTHAAERMIHSEALLEPTAQLAMNPQ